MADPTIQTFCCHPANSTEVFLSIIREFNTDSYNTVCIFSSLLGILGATYQILPREQFSNNHRWVPFSADRGRKIIIWLAVADLMASLGVFVRSTLWINYKNIMPATEDDASVLFCAVSSAITQYFYTATWIWTLCYAIDMRLVLRQKDAHMKFYHSCAWLIPAILTVTGLSLLYMPDANCHYQSSNLSHAVLRILPNYFATYLPIAVVMITNPLLYRNSTEDMQKIITSTTGQFTSRERELMDAVKIKFCVINLIFYTCWVPNLVNGILLWTLWFHLPASWIISIWYIMAFMNPLQALFNCLVYRRWNSGSERVMLPWRKVDGNEKSNTVQSESFTEQTIREEIYPLLHNTPLNSVNLYRSLST